MRHSITMILLSAGIVLSLAGCQKDHSSTGRLSGKAVRFAASTRSAETRAAFSGDGTVTGTDEFERNILSWERIDWEEGDQVMIASDYATVYGDKTKRYATYTVASVTTPTMNKRVSEASVEEMDPDKELFFTDEDSYTFWGVYPAADSHSSTLGGGTVNYTLASAQEADGALPPITKNGKTLTILQPDMDQAVLLAMAANVTTEKVDLDFYPGFTAFEFTLNSAENDIILKELVLTTPGKTSSDVQKSLAGDVVATLATEGNSTYKFTYPSDTKLTYTFPANTVITKKDYVSFTVYALPEDIEGLTLEFHLGANGEDIQIAKLKEKDGEGTKDITFGGRKKHCLRGIAVRGGWDFKYLTLDIDVMDWKKVVVENQSNGSGVQATQFSMSFDDDVEHCLRYVKNPNDKDYRQCWVFGPNNVVTVNYKIMMPTSGTWSIEALGDTAAFTVTVESTGEDGTPSGNTYSGSLSTGATYITITIKAANTSTTDIKTLYFNTYVSYGTSTCNLDSETQLYDMRGHHYFILNGNASTTWDDLNI